MLAKDLFLQPELGIDAESARAPSRIMLKETADGFVDAVNTRSHQAMDNASLNQFEPKWIRTHIYIYIYTYILRVAIYALI